eukprot:RCo008847
MTWKPHLIFKHLTHDYHDLWDSGGRVALKKDAAPFSLCSGGNFLLPELHFSQLIQFSPCPFVLSCALYPTLQGRLSSPLSLSPLCLCHALTSPLYFVVLVPKLVF